MRALKRVLSAVTIASLLVFAIAGMASANVVSKTINTTTGECVISGNPPTLSDGTPCGSATYDPVNGFTGSITFNLGEGSITLADFICENNKDAHGAFTSVGGTYHLTLSSGGTIVSGPTTYTVAGGITCNDGNQSTVYPIALTVPAGTGTYTVQYSLVLDAFDAANFVNDNSILNRVEEHLDGHANSPSVAPPQGNPPVPESPFAILLVATAGLGAAWFVSRKMRIASYGRAV